MMRLILVIAIVIILAASCLMTFALCRAATRRDEMEERWASAASCGQEKEERHEKQPSADVRPRFPSRGAGLGLLASAPRDGSQDFYLSMMLDVPVPRVPMLRARLQDSRRGGAA